MSLQKLPSKVKKIPAGKGLQMAKEAWKTGQDTIKTASKTGK